MDCALVRKLIDKETVEYLKVDSPRVPVFCTLPKVQKSLDDPPRCPIISAVGSLTKKISEYVNRILQPFMRNQFSYVKDISHLLNLLHDLTLPEGTHLVTLDTEALYSSISHDKGLQTTKKILDSRLLDKKESPQHVYCGIFVEKQ